MLPPPMMPEVLLRGATHPLLERRGVFGDDAIDVGLAITGVAHLHRLERQSKLPRRSTQRDAEHHRRAEPQREHRGAARRLRESSEERHPRRRETNRALIDEKRSDST